MTVRSAFGGRQLRITVPIPTELGITITGTLHHPLPDGADVCEVIRRLLPVVPATATWEIQPPAT